MKLVTAIVNKEDSRNVTHGLIEAGFSVTRLSTTGGFLMAGNMTLLIGLPDERVDECIKVIGDHCKQRTEERQYEPCKYALYYPVRLP